MPTASVRSLCKQGLLKQALHNLQLMDKGNICPDSYTYACLLQGCVNIKTMPEGKLVHAHIILTGIEIDLYLGNQLVTTYAKCGRLADARRVLDKLTWRNEVSWTAMIAAYAKHGYGIEAFRLFSQMQRACTLPDNFTFTTVLSACAKMGTLQQGKEIHANTITSGFQYDVCVGSSLVDVYVKCGSIEDARRVFDKMPERNVVSWTSMIAGYAMSEPIDEALSLFQKMPERNVVSWTAMVVAYAKNARLDKAWKLFTEMPERNVISWNAMVAGYAQNGLLDEALKLFERMPERNVVSWNAMIAGYEQNGHFAEAVKLFKQMLLTGLKPDPDTFSSVLPACAQLAILILGKEAHEDIIRSGFQPDAFVGSALIDMYAKCGSIEDARKMFDKMPRLDVVSWTAMIVGYAMHGVGEEAILLFEKMQCFGMKPNNVTFIGVLSACCHAGLVDDGWQYFHSMNRDYGITPTLEHYCCMVDLLGRAGQLDEAQSFIEKMPVKPNVGIWVSLLAACRVYTNTKLGEHAAQNLIELDPTNSAHYVLLSNIYAAACRWEDMEKVRKMMEDRGVRKVTGCSWIEVNNKVYPFFVGERLCPETDRVYAELESLYGLMKRVAYESKADFVLHDVEEQREHILSYHSE